VFDRQLKFRGPAYQYPAPSGSCFVIDPEKLIPPFWRTLLGLLILPPFIASFFLYHVELMVFLYNYTPFTAQNVALIDFGDTD
jgi:hypothetical protein